MSQSKSASGDMSAGRFYAIIGVLMAVEVMSTLESVMIVTALPTIMREFNDPAMTGWLLTAFLLVQAGTAAVGGRLGDIFGRRRVLAIIIGLCALGSLVSATAASLEIIILGRAVQGLSGAILPLCYGIARQVTVPSRTPFWIGVLTGAWAVSSALGYVLAGYFADTGEWRSIFWVTLIYGVLLIAPLMLVAPEFKNPLASRQLDVLGGLLFVPAVASVMYGVTLGGKSGWDAASTWVFLLAGGALVAFWAWYESRRDEPLIDVTLLLKPEIALGNICWVFCGLGLIQMPLVIMMFLQQPTVSGAGLGVTATLASVLKLPSTAVSLVAAPLIGFVGGRYGSRRAVMLGGFVAFVAWVYLILFHDSVGQVVFGSVIAACGSVMLAAALPNLVFEGASIDRSSEVTGLSVVVRGVAAAVGAQTIMSILAWSRVTPPGGSASFPSELAYQLAFGFIAVTGAGALLVGLFIRRRPGPASAVWPAG